MKCVCFSFEYFHEPSIKIFGPQEGLWELAMENFWAQDGLYELTNWVLLGQSC